MLVNILFAVLPLIGITLAAPSQVEGPYIQLSAEGDIRFDLLGHPAMKYRAPYIDATWDDPENPGHGIFVVRYAVKENNKDVEIMCSYAPTVAGHVPSDHPVFKFKPELNGDRNYLLTCGDHGGYTVTCNGRTPASCPKENWDHPPA